MAITSKKVEVYKINVHSEKEDVNFEDILLSESVFNNFAYIGDKHVSVRILDKKNVIVGIVETVRSKNIPPKKHRKDKTTSSIGLKPEEGLVYGNVFLYEKERKILLYEFNKFGSYVNHFIKCLQNCCEFDKKWDKDFYASADFVLNKDEYERFLKMNYFKSIDLKFANPKALIKEIRESKIEKSSLDEVLKITEILQSETFDGKFEVKSKRNGGKGLADKSLKDLYKSLKSLFSTETGSRNISKMTLKGYVADKDGKEILEPIDLLTDRYLKSIKLDEPRLNVDLLEGQRSSEIKALYHECLDDFFMFFGKK